MQYAELLCLREDVLSESDASLTLADFTELELQSLWFSGVFGRHFISTCGRNIHILDFGIWNHNSGPDFQDCRIQVEAQLPRRGGIELDRDCRDWEYHQHAHLPSYREVLLHLFFQAPQGRYYTRTDQNREVIQVQLDIQQVRAFRKTRFQATPRLGQCHSLLQQLHESKIADLLEEAAQHRLSLKAKRLHLLIEAQGLDQALYQNCAAILGYQYNQAAMTLLAQRLHFRLLRPLSPLQREALLLGCSGFLENIEDHALDSFTRHYLRALWSEWWSVRDSFSTWLNPDRLIAWKYSGIRPHNHPQRRIAALALLLQLRPSLKRQLTVDEDWQPAFFLQQLLQLNHPFWQYHSTLLSSKQSKAIQLIGKSRYQEFLANLIYPYFYALQRSEWQGYFQQPAGATNHKIQRAIARIFPSPQAAAPFQKRLYQQQGLLQIYEDFCCQNHTECDHCSMPQHLQTQINLK